MILLVLGKKMSAMMYYVNTYPYPERYKIKIKEYEEEISRLNYQINMKDARHKFLQETEKEKSRN